MARHSMELDKSNPYLNHLCNGADEAMRSWSARIFRS
jgi:hypothetical protein